MRWVTLRGELEGKEMGLEMGAEEEGDGDGESNGGLGNSRRGLQRNGTARPSEESGHAFYSWRTETGIYGDAQFTFCMLDIVS